MQTRGKIALARGRGPSKNDNRGEPPGETDHFNSSRIISVGHQLPGRIRLPATRIVSSAVYQEHVRPPFRIWLGSLMIETAVRRRDPRDAQGTWDTGAIG